MQTASYTGKLTNCSGNRLIVRFFLQCIVVLCTFVHMKYCVCVCVREHAHFLRLCVNACMHVHTLTCQRTSPFSPAGRLTSCHHGARPLAACRSLQHHANSTHRNRSLVLHLGSGNTMPTLVAKQESLLLQTHTYTQERV